LYGEQVTVLSTTGEKVFCQSLWDNYQGFVNSDCLGQVKNKGQNIKVPVCPVFAEADLKSKHICNLYLNSEIEIDSNFKDFVKTDLGWIYAKHLELSSSSPAELAQYFIGTPYVWGGKSWGGIDCSAMVQMVYRAFEINLPRDSIDQQKTLNWDKIERSDKLKQNDLVFWKGHVGIMFDENQVIHANAGDMFVKQQELYQVEKNIIKNGNGEITLILRKNND
jgi:hypothetical protein